MSDLISSNTVDGTVSPNDIMRFPSAEPLEDFEWCTDCKEYDQEKHCCHRWTKVIRQTVKMFVSEDVTDGKGLVIIFIERKKEQNVKKALIVTDAQLGVIQDACELYGRIQLGQFRGFAEIVTQTGFDGFVIRVKPERKEDETDEEYKERCEYFYRRDELTKDCIEGAVEGIYRHAYRWDGKPRTTEANIALDIWAVLDGRREDGFHMAPEPLVQVREVDE